MLPGSRGRSIRRFAGKDGCRTTRLILQRWRVLVASFRRSLLGWRRLFLRFWLYLWLYLGSILDSVCFGITTAAGGFIAGVSGTGSCRTKGGISGVSGADLLLAATGSAGGTKAGVKALSS